jgi:hypothetical protein
VNSIIEWLNGSRSYEIGLALYASHSDGLLSAMFSQGYSEYRHKRLIAELTRLKDTAEHLTIELPSDAPVAVLLPQSKMPEAVVPPAQDPYRDKWLPSFKEMNMLRYRLRQAANDAERGEMAFRILELEDLCKFYWDQRDYFLRTGNHKPEETDPPDTVSDKNALQKRLSTVRTYITKYSKNPDKKKLKDKYEAELALLSKKLKVKTKKKKTDVIEH